MKEQLHTIPVNEAFEAEDECPFCFMERKAERSAIRYVAGPGASYMEPDIRAATSRTGFCTHHMKSLFDYGNALGVALMLQSHYTSVMDELRVRAENPDTPTKKPLFGKRPENPDAYWRTLETRVDQCYICDKIKYNMDRYYHTFFVLLKDAEFRAKVESCKGFCLRHFGKMLEAAEDQLPASQREWFYPAMYRLMLENLERVKGDLDWFINKFDYRNASAPWNNARDALPRAMQKLQGLHPSDPAYKSE